MLAILLIYWEELLYLSKDPGVIEGVSPTLKLLDFLAFFS